MRRERGSLLLYGLVALLVVSVGGGAVWSYNRAIARAEEAEQRAAAFKGAFETQRDANAALTAQRKALDSQLAARRRTDQLQAQMERERDAAIEKAYAAPEVRQWGDVLVPAALLDGVRNDAQPGANGLSAGSPASGMAGAGARAGVAGGDDERAAARLRPPKPATAPAVQQ